MVLPQFFDHTTFHKIPYEKGLYAFFFNFEYLTRSLATHTGPDINVTQTLEKSLRAHTLGTPDKVKINLYGKSTSFSSFLEIGSSHLIDLGPASDTVPTADFNHVAAVLSRCSLFTTPIYIGITENQDFHERFTQHRDNFEKLKLKYAPTPAETYDRSGQFYHRLIRRRIEFRDLLFACVPINSAEISQVRLVEKILHALTNPPLSTSH
jgi:hypothetical protein